MILENYEHYRVEDFIADDYFVAWVVHPQAEANAFWEKFLLQYPHNKEAVASARNYILLLRGYFDQENQNNTGTHEVDQAFRNVKKAVNSGNKKD